VGDVDAQARYHERTRHPHRATTRERVNCARQASPSGRELMTVPQTTKPDVAVAEELDTQGPSADLVRVYLNGIGRTALLTAQEEVDLAKRIEAGVFAKHLLETSGNLSPNRKST